MSQLTPLQRMEAEIANSVSEAEVEAPAEAIWNAESIRAIGKPRSVVWREVLSEHQDRYRQMARAALTAAAQVRAQARNAMPRCEVCGGHHNIGNPCPGPDKPALIPIYGATEDLQQDLVQATSVPAEADRDHPMVKRVAEALKSADEARPSVDDADDFRKVAARAAIGAMRDPTPEMHDAAYSVGIDHPPAEYWAAMIAAALGKPKA